ncbi:nucleolar protein 6 [Anthonomus grandis grandis]|uniref:nucleolar protein 6 n=1 Tax=Anthonomus grandis grandis TaxID=2921223 RepID=UPI0021668002|nr:nucleolar protein 6 [Anthonomus grandis grandis]
MNSWDEASISSMESEPEKPLTGEKKKRKLEKNVDSNDDNKRSVGKKVLKGQKKSSADKTLQVLNYVKATEQLYNNNLFRLQLDELLKQVEIKNKRKNALKVFLDQFKEILDKLKPATVNNTKELQILNIKSDQETSLKFEKPIDIECFGLYENNCLPGPVLEACINLTMPRTCFHIKDFSNNRYFVKRLLYLTQILKHLPYEHKRLEFHNSNVLLPVVHLQPGVDDDKFIIKIFVTPPEDYFKDERFLPRVNNMKQDLFESGIKDLEVLRVSPTVLYNSALAFDVTLHRNWRFIVETLKDQENVQKGVKLLGIWLKQRHLNVGFGSFSTDLLAYYVAFLLIKKKINNLMSPYQIIRNFWSFFTSTNLGECNCFGNSQHADLFKSSFKVNLIDPSGCYNLAAFWDPDHVKKVKEESQRALELLDSCNPQKDGFQCLFLTKMPICLQYDVVIDISESLPLRDVFNTTNQQKTHFIGYEQHHRTEEIKNLLKKGLTNRFQLIVPYRFIKYPEKRGNSVLEKVQFGINLNPETCFNFIEKGPALSDFVNAEQFRQFWGPLSSDRRFRDGSTHVAVYFKTTTARGKRHIIKRIIKYVLTEKLNLKCQVHYDDFDVFLLAKGIFSAGPVGTNEEPTNKCVTVADQLGQKLRSFKLPLGIFGIQGGSDTFSYCQVFPSVASRGLAPSRPEEVKGNNIIFPKQLEMVPRYIEPLEVVLKTEQSSKWPKDPEALKSVRTSYFLEISKLLAKENILSNVIQDFLQIYYEGLTFRYRIYLPHETHLHKEPLKYLKNLKVLPQVNASLKGLQQQFPSYGPGTALIKRWLRGHMIDSHHLPDPVINLLNASLYLNQFGYPHSCSPQLSFIRFLKFFGEFEWETQPVLVNFNEQLGENEIKEAERNFQENRGSLPPLVLLVPYDDTGMIFTKKNPSREVMGMVKALCQAALDLVVSRVENCHLFDLNALFVPKLEGFNVLIHLRPQMNPRRHEQLINNDDKIQVQEYKHHKGEKIPIIGFNPVDFYLETLRTNYGHFATFFHDTYGGNVIGLLWNPQVTKGTPAKQNNFQGMTVDGSSKLVFNEDALIEDFYAEGKGIVEWIEKNS